MLTGRSSRFFNSACMAVSINCRSGSIRTASPAASVVAGELVPSGDGALGQAGAFRLGRDEVELERPEAGLLLEAFVGDVAHHAVRVVEQPGQMRREPAAARGVEGWLPAGVPCGDGALGGVAL